MRDYERSTHFDPEKISRMFADARAQSGVAPGDRDSVNDHDPLTKAVIMHRLFGRAPLAPKLGDHAVLRRIGAGSTGIVYETRSPRVGRAATKLVWSSVSARSRGQRLADALVRLQHVNTARVLDVGATAGRVFVSMEYLSGVKLSQWLIRHARRWNEVARVFMEAGHGLAAAHAAGVVHGDFRPGNVMLCDTSEVKVLDFGLRPSTSDVDLKSDVRGDVYSFCRALRAALNDSAAPCDISSVSRDQWRASTPAAPASLQRMLARGLATQPEHRFSSMGELLLEFERVA